MIDPRDLPKLPQSAYLMLTAERDAEAARLARQSEEVRALSPLEYLARGLWMRQIEGDLLLAKLARKQWDCLEYIDGKPGWRVLSRSSEYYISREEVEQAFGTTESRGTPNE